MFKGPSLYWSALNHWFLPSLSPISSLSATLARHLSPLATLRYIKSAHHFLGISLFLHYIILIACWTLVCEEKQASLLFTKLDNHQGSSVYTSGLAAAAVLWLAACHQQRVIGPKGFRAEWCVWMAQSYPVISNGACCHREAEWSIPIITTSYSTTHLFGSCGGLEPNCCRDHFDNQRDKCV